MKFFGNVDGDVFWVVEIGGLYRFCYIDLIVLIFGIVVIRVMVFIFSIDIMLSFGL